jgi:hypothetical protein
MSSFKKDISDTSQGWLVGTPEAAGEELQHAGIAGD